MGPYWAWDNDDCDVFPSLRELSQRDVRVEDFDGEGTD